MRLVRCSLISQEGREETEAGGIASTVLAICYDDSTINKLFRNTEKDSSDMQMIKTRAAVAWAPNEPLKIEELDLMPPQKGEVLVPCLVKILKVCSRVCWAMRARA